MNSCDNTDLEYLRFTSCTLVCLFFHKVNLLVKYMIKKTTSPTLRRSSSDSCITSATTEPDFHVPPGAPPPPPPLSVPYKIFVGSLPSYVNEMFLYYYMSVFGRVKSVSLKRNIHTGHSRRYGYVKFYEPLTNDDIFTKAYYIGEKRIRIQRYQVNPCWKKDFVSSGDECTDEDIGDCLMD